MNLEWREGRRGWGKKFFRTLWPDGRQQMWPYKKIPLFRFLQLCYESTTTTFSLHNVSNWKLLYWFILLDFIIPVERWTIEKGTWYIITENYLKFAHCWLEHKPEKVISLASVSDRVVLMFLVTMKTSRKIDRQSYLIQSNLVSGNYWKELIFNDTPALAILDFFNKCWFPDSVGT